MDTDPILTFRAPAREPGRVDAVVSPVLELAYAAFSVVKRGRAPAATPSTPPWSRQLADDAPEVVDALFATSGTGAHGGPGVETFLLAARYGYVRDADPERFLRDVGGLASRYLAEGVEPETVEDPATIARVTERLQRLRDPSYASAWADAQRALWRALGPRWEREGRPAASAAVDAFRRNYGETGSVHAALPSHHFVQFEAGAQSIRKAEAEGRVLVVPLGLAVAGGFHFDIDGTLYIGYGLQAESLHERTAERMGVMAQRMKPFADPTRVMLLALIGRFAGLQLTVGDLATQLGVSQPTVSGHLRLLREAGLVQLEKRGNKAYHRLDVDALHDVLTAFERAVVEGPDLDPA
jgi:DNA-binding transcriptional ArsR family regulator